MKKINKKILSLALLTQVILACSSFSRNTDKSVLQNSTPVKIIEAQPLKASEAPISSSSNVQAAHDEVKKQLAQIKSGTQENTPNPAVPAHAAHSELVGVAADKALAWLKNGNIRFTRHHLRKDGQSTKDVRRLASGQKPHTIVFACSDSRVPPEILFDEKLGELFVIRTAGETLDQMGIASAEYALMHLGARHILVLGHTNCGAVKAACTTLNGGDAGTPSLNSLVKDIHPRIQQFKDKPASVGYVDEVWANTEGVADDLPKRSSVIDSMVKEKSLKISTAIYNLDTGKVSFK